MEYRNVPHHELKRPYYLKMPPLTKDVSGIIEQSKTRETVVVIPLFAPDIQLHRIKLNFQTLETYCKRAVWTAYELFTGTDIKEAGISFYLGVQSEIAEIIRHYTDLCNFPDDCLFFIDKFQFKGNSRKIDILNAIANCGFQKVISIDTHTAFISKGREPMPLFRRLKGIWQNEVLSFFKPYVRDYLPVLLDIGNCTSQNEYERKVLGYTGEPLHVWKERRGLPSLRGGMFGMTTDFLNTALQELKRINEFVLWDEILFSLYVQCHNPKIAFDIAPPDKWGHYTNLLATPPEEYNICHFQQFTDEDEANFLRYYESILR